MNNYFQLTENEQRLVLQQAAARYGLPAQAIEKDLWVSTILQIVFTLPFAEMHSNLVGSVPGKSQTNNSGSDKRELYTIAQALQTSAPHYKRA